MPGPSLTTYPSRAVSIIDIPEVENLTTEFIYNIYVPDERENDEQPAIPTRVIDDEFMPFVQTEFPRKIILRFNPPKINPLSEISADITDTEFDGAAIWGRIKAEQDKILIETATGVQGYASFNLQASSMENLVSVIFNDSLNIRDINFKGSMTDKAKRLNQLTSDDITGDFIMQAFSNNSTSGVQYRDPKTNKIIKNSYFNEIQGPPLFAKINTKIAHKLASQAASFPSRPFSQDLAKKISKLRKQQQKDSAITAANNFSTHDFFPPLPSNAVITTNNVAPVITPSRAKVIGFIIEKYEIMDGKIIKKPNIILPGADVSSFNDTNVKCDATYTYTIRTLARIALTETNQDDMNVVENSYIFASRTSNYSLVRTFEEEPVQSPRDINFHYDENVNGLNIYWNFPFEKTGDIKKFHIYRRKSISEQFTLVAEINFDQTSPPYARNFSIKHSRILKFPASRLIFSDGTFNAGSEFIYAITAVDVRDNFSNYSTQFKVKWDTNNMELSVKAISSAGAPLAYPNFFINYIEAGFDMEPRLYEDVIKSSGQKKMKIYFDPEYYNLTKKINLDGPDGNQAIQQTFDLVALKKKENGADGTGGSNSASSGKLGKYRFQIINIDRQKSRDVILQIDDLRNNN